MFLQIHSLTSYHATLLNRDDAGLAKRIPFGNASRLRVSSQCLKRHWRETLQDLLDLPDGIRSRHFFGREVLTRLVNEKKVDAALADKLTRQLGKALISSSDGGRDPLDESFQMKQPVLFGRSEANFLVDLLAECTASNDPEKALEERLKTDKKNFNAMLRQAGHGNLFAGVEGALFGRFVTSDILARSDAAVHVAHSFTVHKLDTEVDYFTVVDDLNREEETGAAHAGDMELGAGLFYGYVVVDIPLLVSNFTGCDPKNWTTQDPHDVCTVLETLVGAIATVSPGAKLGATAPYAYSEFMLLETGRQQPRTLANAYLEALPTREDLMQSAIERLSRHLRALDKMYGKTAELRVAATTRSLDAEIAETNPLDQSIQDALDNLFGDKRHAHPAATL